MWSSWGHCTKRLRLVIILDYNHNKGGVDNLDKVIGTYSCRRMTALWPLVIFHNIIDVSSYNAFVIWNKINPTWMPDKRKQESVVPRAAPPPHSSLCRACESCSGGWILSWSTWDCSWGRQEEEMPILPPKKDCKTNNMCCTCEKYICKVHAHTLVFRPTCANYSWLIYVLHVFV